MEGRAVYLTAALWLCEDIQGDVRLVLSMDILFWEALKMCAGLM